jgi:hypothetical protein
MCFNGDVANILILLHTWLENMIIIIRSYSAELSLFDVLKAKNILVT